MQQGRTALAGREAEAGRAHVQASLFIVTEDWKQKKMTHLCEEALKRDLQMKTDRLYLPLLACRNTTIPHRFYITMVNANESFISFFHMEKASA